MTISKYRSSLRSPIRGLWRGIIDSNQFFDSMETAIRRHLTEAWYSGAAECGIKPDELTGGELNRLNSVIFGELVYIGDLAEAIEASSKGEGGKLQPFLNRAELWINRYSDTQNQARMMACQDQKLEWVLGAAEKHCTTCPRLNGQVRRGSFWQNKGVQPQQPPNPYLECGGWKCLCSLKPTDKPASKGKLPKTP